MCAYVGFLLFLKSISLYQKICLSTHKKYLSNKCNKYKYIYIYICLKRRRRPEVRSTEQYLYQSCLINCDLGDQPTPIGGVRQHFL